MIASISLAIALAAQSQDPPPGRAFLDTPEHHWFYQGLGVAENLGLEVIIEKSSYGVGRPPTNYELSVTLHHVVSQLGALTESARLAGRQAALTTEPTPVTRKTCVEAFANLEAFKSSSRQKLLTDLDVFLHRAQKEFGPELAALAGQPMPLGEAVPRFRSFLSSFQPPQFGDAYGQFPDVPSDHWAAKAILDLRKWGIIDGYPDGKFGD